MDVADAHLAVGEDAENPKTRRIGQGAIHPRKFVNSSHQCGAQMYHEARTEIFARTNTEQR